MQITGYQLKSALQRWTLRKDTAYAVFPSTLAKFAGEDRESPQSVTERIVKAEQSIATLQAFQARYNLAVSVSVGGQTLSLCEVVKRVGGAARLEKIWRDLAAPPRVGRHAVGHSAPGARDKDYVYPEATVTPEQAAKLTEHLAKEKNLLEQGIAEANATPIDLPIPRELIEG